jgi:hypothetical protein
MAGTIQIIDDAGQIIDALTWSAHLLQAPNFTASNSFIMQISLEL